MSLKAIFQGRRYLVLSQTDDGVWLVSLDRSATLVHVGVDHRDLMLNPSESDARLAEAYTLAEEHETNPRSIWGFVQGLTRLSQRTPWQDGRYVLDRAASRLLATVH